MRGMGSHSQRDAREKNGELGASFADRGGTTQRGTGPPPGLGRKDGFSEDPACRGSLDDSESVLF